MNKQIQNIFLSGCMSYYYDNNKSNLAEDWRNEAIRRLGDKFNIFNPCVNYNENINYEPRGIVYQNITYLNKADLVILNVNKLGESPGTLFELYASFFKHKPVISFGNSVLLDQPHVHEVITMHFIDLDSACDYIENMYCQ